MTNKERAYLSTVGGFLQGMARMSQLTKEPIDAVTAKRLTEYGEELHQIALRDIEATK